MGLIKIVGIHFAMEEAKDGHLQFFGARTGCFKGKALLQENLSLNHLADSAHL